MGETLALRRPRHHHNPPRKRNQSEGLGGREARDDIGYLIMAKTQGQIS